MTTTTTTERMPIELTNVTRNFGDVTALDGLDLRVESEEIYGFLGPNGAGKTTTIGLLVNFLRPTTGRVRVFGRDPRNDEVAVKARTGILPEGFTPYPGLTGRDHLTLACRLRDEHDPGAYLQRVGLSDSADQKAGEYSRGMTKRLGLAMALVGSPELLVLDEPIAGLDPHGAARVKEIIEAENDRGTTVFFSSHQLAHVEEVCDRVGIVTDGRTIAEESIDEFRASVDSSPTLTVIPETPPTHVPDSVRRLDVVDEASVDGSTIVVDCTNTGVRSDIVVALTEAGIEVAEFETDRPSLEDVFAAYVD